MKLHEYQAKALLASYGVAIPKGGVASSPPEARQVAERLGGACVVKAQVHAGGRGKAGGVRLARTAQEAERSAAQLLGSRLVTHQTGPQGAPVGKVLVEETLDIGREMYLGLLLDGSAGAPVVVASGAGGVEIEDLAAEHPEMVLRELVRQDIGLQPFQCRRLARALGLSQEPTASFSRHLMAMYDLFMAKDCSLIEVNPLVLTRDERVVALDAKVTIDDSALFRHPEMTELRDWSQEDSLEAKALQAGISYVRLNGTVGCLVNGAGLAMATMDTVRAAGCEPANFLDVGGGARPERVAQTVRLVLEDTNVRQILVNVFGGIARCDEIAQGIADGIPPDRRDIPVLVRFLGTNAEEGRRILQRSGLPVHPIASLADGVAVLKRLTAA
ncbi:MAG: ADP-forming succinate--CoA ligase subunit beta [Chloroflexi bacterium]|nr:ADP-forming succinate--CoA ligase subunit beta [Chloroflexota bacterium]